MDFFNSALDFLFPQVCGICEKTGKSLCNKCEERLKKSPVFLERIEDYNIKSKYYFEKHCYLFLYYGIIRKKIIEYKYGKKSYLKETFTEILIKSQKVCGFLKNYDIIIPVPISNKKMNERGYNQSELISRKISKKCNIKFEKNILKKTKNNKVQSLLNREERLQNVKNVYEIENIQKIKNKKILIFDDIFTTGATVNECAKILKKAGASKIGILTIAKDIMKL